MERNDTLTAAAAPRRELSGGYLDWTAILGGAVVAAAIAGLLMAFGTALGLASISVEPGGASFSLWALITAIFMAVSLALSYLAGGYVAGRMRRRVDEASGDEVATRDGLNGLVVWALGVLFTAVMAAGAVGHLTSAAGSVAGSAIEGAGAAVGGAAQGVAEGVSGEAGEGMLGYLNTMLMRPTLSGTTPAATPGTPGTPAAGEGDLAAQTAAILGNVLRTGEIPESDRAFLISAVAARSGLDSDEVEARVNEAVSAVQDARTEAIETARNVAETARISAVLTAFLLTASALIAAAAAVGGAVRGGRHRDEGRLFGGLAFRL